jgi:hypothetical protein
VDASDIEAIRNSEDMTRIDGFSPPSLSPSIVAGGRIGLFLESQNQNANTTTVDGKANAQYTQWLSWMTGLEPHWRDGTAKSAAKNVAGRKVMVMIAMAFIEVLSSFAARAISILDDAS